VLEEAPLELGRFRNSNPAVCRQLDLPCARTKPDAFTRAQIAFVIGSAYPERLGEFSRTGAERMTRFRSATHFHFANSAGRLERADQDDSLFGSAFDENIEEPMEALIQIDIIGAGRMSFDKRAGTWARERMARLIVDDAVGFRFDDESGAVVPNEFAPNQCACARERIDLKKIARQKTRRPRGNHNPVG
jgi:hypothetical protein